MAPTVSPTQAQRAEGPQVRDLAALVPELVEGRRLRSALDEVPALIGYWDRDLRTVVANKSYGEWFGVSPERLTGMHVSELLGEEVYQASLPHLRRALAGELQQFDCTLVGPDGVARYSQATYVPDRRGGEAVGFVVLVADVSQRVRAELALQAEQARTAARAAETAHLVRQLELVSRVSSQLHGPAVDLDRVQGRVSDTVVELGYDGALIVVDPARAVACGWHGRGVFQALEGERPVVGASRASLEADSAVVVADYQLLETASTRPGTRGCAPSCRCRCAAGASRSRCCTRAASTTARSTRPP